MGQEGGGGGGGWVKEKPQQVPTPYTLNPRFHPSDKKKYCNEKQTILQECLKIELLQVPKKLQN